MMKFIAIILTLLMLLFAPLIFQKTSTEETTTACPPLEITLTTNPQPIPLEQYVQGVTQAEMPLSFHPEALKAQAIAARTFALQTTRYGATPIEPTTAHQVFQPAADVESISETESLIITYNNEPITAMFHSTSNGKTESAENYSGRDVPYLQSVSSPLDLTNNPTARQTKTYSLKEWNRYFEKPWTSDDFTKMRVVRNDSNRVEQVETAQGVYTGREFRDLLELRSTDFQIGFADGLVTVRTTGYGHGVGMSQYGADALAQIGYSAEEILAYYYPGTALSQIDGCLKITESANTDT